MTEEERMEGGAKMNNARARGRSHAHTNVDKNLIWIFAWFLSMKEDTKDAKKYSLSIQNIIFDFQISNVLITSK